MLKKNQILYSPRTSRVDEYYTIIAIIIMPIIFGMCSGMLLVSKTCLISQKNPEFKKFQLTKLI